MAWTFIARLVLGLALADQPLHLKFNNKECLPTRRVLDSRVPQHRMLQGLLVQERFKVGRLHVATLMKRMAIEAIYRRPNNSKPAPGHEFYLYLLRKLPVTRPSHVCAIDITFIPMARGFIYLAAVMDWFTRRVVAWRVTITSEVDFYIEDVEELWRVTAKPSSSTAPRAVSSRLPTSSRFWPPVRSGSAGMTRAPGATMSS